MKRKSFWITLILFLGISIALFLLSTGIEDVRLRAIIAIYSGILIIVGVCNFIAPFLRGISEPLIGLTIALIAATIGWGIIDLFQKVDSTPNSFNSTFAWYHDLSIVIVGVIFFFIFPIRKKFMEKYKIDIQPRVWSEEEDQFDADRIPY